MTLLEELEGTVQHAVERIGPAVVGLGRGWGVGSGVVVAQMTRSTSALASDARSRAWRAARTHIEEVVSPGAAICRS